jgi:SAM-dependent methyltransferase
MRLACPIDHEALSDTLECVSGHRFREWDGIPVLLREDIEPSHPPFFEETWAALGQPAKLAPEPFDGIDPFVRNFIVGTCGNLYRGTGARLRRYPIPRLPLPAGEGRRLLDIGCSWGRWTIAADRAGYQAIGLDPHLSAVDAARRVARACDANPAFVVGDARYLPFLSASFDNVWSYSVLQHFRKHDAQRAIAEIGRVLRPGGTAVVQIAHKFGLRNLINRARRSLAKETIFDVRYWSLPELEATFGNAIGPVAFEVDGFFSLNAQVADIDLLPRVSRVIVRASHMMTRAAGVASPLRFIADSVYVRATKIDAKEDN